MLPSSQGYPKLSPTNQQMQRSLPYSHYMNNYPHERVRNGNGTVGCGGRFNQNGKLETANEVARGPRSLKKNSSADPSEINDLGFLVPRKDRYNLPDFETEYENANFFVIKSFNEDDVHKSIKYEVWTSTQLGNEKLNAAFHDARSLSEKTGNKCPIFLFFSVNRSGQFLGVAEIVGQFDYDKDMDFWTVDMYRGFFPIRWHIIKDVPYNKLNHIILEYNDNRPVTWTRDTQEIDLKNGIEMLKIFKSYVADTSLLDDFKFYETRENSLHSESRSKGASSSAKMHWNYDSQTYSTSQVEMNGNDNSHLYSSSLLQVRSNANYQMHSGFQPKVHGSGNYHKNSNSKVSIHGNGCPQDPSGSPVCVNGNGRSQMHARQRVNENQNSEMPSSSESGIHCNSNSPTVSSSQLKNQNNGNSKMCLSSSNKIQARHKRSQTRSSDNKGVSDPAAYLFIGAKNRVLSHEEVKNIALQRRAAKLAASNTES